MAEVIKKAVNKFTKGLVMDFSPENTQNEVLTHALNATLLTFNGNELSLQNDMGNARVETAYLPNGYIPVGTCEFGGIIYIVSYNPLENKSQIGCFPSPERNISSDELGIPQNTISMANFQESQQRYSDPAVPTGKITHTSHCVTLKQDKLNPGDKFIICSDDNIYEENLVDLLIKENGHFKYKDNPRIALNIVSIEESGKIVYLNSDLLQYEEDHTVDNQTNTYKYHILGKLQDSSDLQPIDIDNYRNTLQSGYSVFKSKTSGKLALLAELVTIDSYSVTHSIQPRKRSGDYTPLQGNYEIVIHTDVTASIPNGATTVNNNVFNLIPKLKYYYLQNSQGQIPIANPTQDELNDKQIISRDNGTYLTPLFRIDEYGKELPIYNPHFLNHKLSDIYNSTVLRVEGDSEEKSAVIVDSKLSDSSLFNFPKPQSYYGRMESYDGTLDDVPEYTQIYTKFTENKYHRAHRNQFVEGEYVDVAGGSPVFIVNNWDKHNYFKDELQAKFYSYSEDGGYSKVEGKLVELQTYYTKTSTLEYIDVKRDEKEKGSQLWKLENPIPTVAEKEQLYDDTIEKWIVGEKHIYVPIPHEDLPTFSGNVYVYEENEEGAFEYRIYKETTFDPDTDYYSYEYYSDWVSIGYTPIPENYKTLIYYFKDPAQYREASLDEVNEYWDFTKYPYDENHAMFGAPFTLFIQNPVDTYYEATLEERSQYEEGKLELFENSHYVDIVNFAENEVLFVVVPNDAYVPTTYFEPNVEYNYIAGLSDKGTAPSGNAYEKDDPLYLYKIADFIPKESNNPDETTITYDDVRLATIKIPDTLTKNKCDLLFKYDYTIVPCMDYGRLDWLAVSNTIDFSNLHNFDQSNFNTWKYRIDGNQLRLTFGADIYDTFVDEISSDRSKVDALVLEFYDLWGFAGSIEISGKKAYSGIFTKLLALNTLGALSTKKIVGTVHSNGEIIGNYSSDYCRNISIIKHPNSNQFSFDGREIKRDDVYGWYYTQPKVETETVDIDESNPREFIASDCGTLYSNLIYGVKTYIRQSTSSGEYVFTPKTEFFLFTLPIYNEYYYVKNNFNELGNPALKFALTYKIKDQSTMKVHSNEGLQEGYHSNGAEDGKIDYDNVKAYKSGTYDKTTLDLVRYYTYEGTSNLQLEIGLQREYQDFNISCLSDINKHFTCELQLLSEDDKNKSFSVKSSSEETSADLLNYNWDDKNKLSFDLNKIGFKESYDQSLKITNKFDDYNFLYEGATQNVIPINYSFTVGYLINISNIRDTQVPATTVCALCHKQEDGRYNYEDFGIYEYDGNYYSNAMFYNEGTAEQEIFGICKQIAMDGDMQNQCLKITTEINDAEKITNTTAFNTGTHLKNLLNYIGKLQFCQPHLHGFSTDNGVNVYDNYIIGPDTTHQYKNPDDEKPIDFNSNNVNGTVPSVYLYNNPRYNLSLNTKMMIDHQGEFISTIDYLTSKAPIPFSCTSKETLDYAYLGVDYNFPARVYTGITGQTLEKFNKNLVETMKYVYAYNPDYDSLQVSLGDVTVKDKNIQFISNLISTNAKLDGVDNLNTFICIGETKIDTYLKQLNEYSNIIVDVPQVQFTSNLTYCGESNPILLSALTYNTQAPNTLYDELSFSASGQIVVQDHERNKYLINGKLDKKALYGFLPDYNKLIQLQLNTYKIEQSGKLSLLHDGSNITFSSYNGQINSYNMLKMQEKNLKSDDGSNVKLVLQTQIDTEEPGIYLNNDGLYRVFVACPKGESFKLNSKIIFEENQNNLYTSNISKMRVQIYYKVFQSQVSIANKSHSIIEAIKSNFTDAYALYDGTFKLTTNEGTTSIIKPDDPGTDSEGNAKPFNLVVNGIARSNGQDVIIGNQCDIRVQNVDDSDFVLLYVVIRSVDFNVYKAVNLQDLNYDIIPVDKIYDFSGISNSKYTIKDTYVNRSVCFIGTNLTIGDLVYEPNTSGHRLYVRDNCCVYNDHPRSRIFYRTLAHDKKRINYIDHSWCYFDLDGNPGTQYLNNIYLRTGPCFTEHGLTT